MKQNSTLRVLDSFSLGALIIAMCSQLNVRRLGRDTLEEGLGYASRVFSVSLADVVFAAVVGWFVVRTIQTKSWKKLWWPPLPCWALIFALLISAIHGANLNGKILTGIAEAGKFTPKAVMLEETKEAIKTIVQFIGFFIVAPLVFVNLLHDRREGDLISRRGLAIKSLVAAVLLTVVVGGLQAYVFDKRARPDIPHNLDSSLIIQAIVPRGLFGSGNVYSAALAVVIPLLWPLYASLRKDKAPHLAFLIGWPLVTLAAVATMASVPAIFALLAGSFLALILTARTQPGAIKGLVVATAMVFIGFSAALPIVKEGRADFTRLNSDKQAVKKQYIEWEVAARWNTPRERAFATGVAPGNYQKNIGELYQYDSLPNEEKMPPDSNNLFLVQAVSIGILGLGALLWIVGHFLATARQSMANTPGDWLPAGVIGSLASWLIVNNFHALIVRGAGLILIFLFALAVISLQGERNQSAPALSEQ